MQGRWPPTAAGVRRHAGPEGPAYEEEQPMKIVFPIVAGIVAVSAAVHARSPGQVEAGEALFLKEGCNKCHQVAGRGSKLYPLDGVAKKLTAAEMRAWLTTPAKMEAKLPKRPMVKMSSKKYAFTPEQVDALIAYLQTLK
jgi:mono/diheme cytochrome c family protein